MNSNFFGFPFPASVHSLDPNSAQVLDITLSCASSDDGEGTRCGSAAQETSKLSECRLRVIERQPDRRHDRSRRRAGCPGRGVLAALLCAPAGVASRV
jgi:hypothetical protein